MQLTHESPRARWLVMLAAWAVAAVLIWSHHAARQDYVRLLDGLGLHGAAEARTPLRQVLPARYADAHLWVQHALAAGETGEARVRFTKADNAPHGREVHWSSAFGWLVRGAGAVRQSVTGESRARALEHALLWFNAPVLFGSMVLLSAWAARRAGAGAGVLVAFALVGHKRLYEGFWPAYVDHHGLVSVAVLGLVLGLAFMGGGWWRPAEMPGGVAILPRSPAAARRAAIGSALGGAFGLWLSAAAVLPVIALVGAAGLAAAWWQGRAALALGAKFDAGAWRLWGRVGGTASVACYLLEYAPGHLGLRLEVNHPLYAAAWWGGAEVVAALAEWRTRGDAPIALVLRRLALPAIAVLAAPLTIIVGGTRVFLVADPFVGELRHFVAEGMTLASFARQFGAARIAYDLLSLLVLVPAVWLLVRRRDETRPLLALLAALLVALAVMATLEMRWWPNAAAAQVAVLVACLAAFPWRRLWIGAAALVLVVLGIERVATDRSGNRARAVAAGDLMEPLYRDLAAALRDTQPEGEIVLLANPNASAGIGYYGRFRTLGTLYWENAAGLRAAAEIFGARSDDEAFRLVRARGVTHVAMLSAANFLGEYDQLLHPKRDPAEAKKGFGFRLLARESLPSWLQPIPYRVPPELKEGAGTVALFKVVAAGQDPLQQIFAWAVAQAASGDVGGAEKAIAQALALAPPQARLALCEAAGEAFYSYEADAAAVRVLRQGLALGGPPMLVNTLAWILATSGDAAVRDGRAALALIEPRVRAEERDPTILSTLAAAYAEQGRFAEAVRAAERALAAVRGDASTERLLQQRLDSYRTGRPWRR